MQTAQTLKTRGYSKLFKYAIVAYALALVGCGQQGASVGAAVSAPVQGLAQPSAAQTFISYSGYNSNFAVRAELTESGELSVDREWMNESRSPEVGKCVLDPATTERLAQAAQQLAQAQYEERLTDCPMQAPEEYSGLRVLSTDRQSEPWMGVFQATVNGCGDFAPIAESDRAAAEQTAREISELAMSCELI